MARATGRNTDIDEARADARNKDDAGVVPYEAETPLGRRLMEIRARIVASGQPLLDWDEIEREVAERRGGVANES